MKFLAGMFVGWMLGVIVSWLFRMRRDRQQDERFDELLEAIDQVSRGAHKHG